MVELHSDLAWKTQTFYETPNYGCNLRHLQIVKRIQK